MARYGLIGRHLSHSFSQRYFTEQFAREGRTDHRYDLFELEHIEQFSQLIASTRDLLGLNVTIPYKQAVIPHLHAVDPIAAAVGAVNTIRIHEGRLTGHNTDVEGFRTTLLPLIGSARPRALVLGSGGASRAVVFVLRELGIKFRVVSRSRETGDLTWEQLDPPLVGVCPLLINTTPLGMVGLVDEVLDAGVRVTTTIKNEGKEGFLHVRARLSSSEGEWSRAQKLHFNRGESKELAWFFSEPSVNAANVQSWVKVSPGVRSVQESKRKTI